MRVVKYIIMMLLNVSITISQVDAVSLKKISRGELELRQDFNSDGKIEYLHAASIIKMGKDTYWVKDGQLINSSNTKTFDFREIFSINNIPVVNQVKAKFGYIISFTRNEKTISVSISDPLGNRNSDELLLEIE